MTQILVNAVAIGDGVTLNARESSRGYPRLVSVVISGTATVQLWGRLDANNPWFALGTAFTVTGVQAVSLPPSVKFTVSAWTSGTVNGWVDAYPTQ
jgi:hypothetical protein